MVKLPENKIISNNKYTKLVACLMIVNSCWNSQIAFLSSLTRNSFRATGKELLSCCSFALYTTPNPPWDNMRKILSRKTCTHRYWKYLSKLMFNFKFGNINKQATRKIWHNIRNWYWTVLKVGFAFHLKFDTILKRNFLLLIKLQILRKKCKQMR